MNKDDAKDAIITVGRGFDDRTPSSIIVGDGDSDGGSEKSTWEDGLIVGSYDRILDGVSEGRNDGSIEGWVDGLIDGVLEGW